MKKISIIIPCYNVERYIAKCIESVYRQGLPETDFELIIINDESTDETLSSANEITKNKDNVKIISQKNKGLGGARNTGIYYASGKYLLFLDADDHLISNVLSDLYTMAESDSLDILEFSAQGVNSTSEVSYHQSNNSQVFSSGIEYYCKVRYMNSACNKLYRREFLVINNLMFLEQIFIEDFEFNTRCFVEVQRIKATDLLAVQFLQSENSITRNKDEVKKKKMVTDIVRVIKLTDKLYKSTPPTEKSKIFFLERLNFLVATLFFQLVKRNASNLEVKELKTELRKEHLFYTNHPIFDFKKNLFRILLLKNLNWYPLIRIFRK